MSVSFVDFSNVQKKPAKTKQILYDKNYGKLTTDFYKVMRERKLNVISQTYDFNNCEEKAFGFEYQWDPFTGMRGEKDPYGALYFHPDDLIHYFYINRLRNLWIPPINSKSESYSGYYGDAVRGGENMNIVGKGLHPELYVFRLPVNNCYLEEGNDMSLITMGPKLTDEEIKNIDSIANKYHKNNYFEIYRKKRPSLTVIKKWYDQAICETTANESENIFAVEKLKNL